MQLFDLREPVNAWSHGIGMMLALPVTWVLCSRSAALKTGAPASSWSRSVLYQRTKTLALFIFGLSLIACYGTSAAFHAVRFQGEILGWLQRLDHIGIYLLIAGTYTPISWGLLRDRWLWGTLGTVWTVSLLCSARVWWGSPAPVLASTLTYLVLGWGAVFCYRELLRYHSHRALLPLPIGGVFYSVGAVINLARWPVLIPGVFGSHELFHLFVIAGSSSHIFFMLAVVVPTSDPALAPTVRPSRPMLALQESLVRLKQAASRSPARLRFPPWNNFVATRERIALTGDQLVDMVPTENRIEAA